MIGLTRPRAAIVQASAFSPLDLGLTEYWTDTALDSFVGGVASTWSSGVAAHSLTSPNGPGVYNNLANGKSVAHAFSSQYLTSASVSAFSGASAFTLFLVFKADLYQADVICAGANTSACVQRYPTARDLVVYAEGSSYGTASGLSHPMIHALIVRYDGSKVGNSGRLRVRDGAVVLSPTYTGTVPASLPTGAGFDLFRYLGGGAEMTGWVACVGMKAGTITDAEEDSLASYLIARYIPKIAVCIGDSITAGNDGSGVGADAWQTAWPKVYSDASGVEGTWDVRNLGVDGSTLAAWKTQVTTVAGIYLSSAHTAKRLIVALGTNDLAEVGGSTANALADLDTLIAHATAAGFTQIYVHTILPRDDAYINGGGGIDASTFESRRLAYNAALVGRSGITGVVDHSGNANLGTPSNATYFRADKLHLTVSGESEMASDTATQVPS